MKNTGIELIAIERQEQIEKHGWDLTRDQDYKANELSRAAKFCLSPHDETLWPWHDQGIGTHFMNKVKNKSYQKRLVICGAFCAAELDRINGVTFSLFDILLKTVDLSLLPQNLISKKQYELLLPGDKSNFEAVYSYLNTNNYNFERFQLLGYKQFVNIPRREAE